MIDYIKWLNDSGIEMNKIFGGYDYMLKQIKNGSHLSTREQGINKFSFAIPSEQVLNVIAQFSPILEVGAGSGYWAYELSKLGVDIIATDPEPYSDNKCTIDAAWCNVEMTNASQALDKYPNRTLMFCWPSYAVSWPTDALKQYKGKTVIYIGEWGGCTADDEFHEILDNEFKETLVIALPQWSGLHDKLFICQRK